MNETRKEIIELIEFYMDKTFCQWLYYIYKWDLKIIWETWLYRWPNEEIDWQIVTYHWLWMKTEEDMIEWWEKILWHYDITAVLKYIWNRWKLKLSSMTFDVCDLQDNLLWEIKINKPLHLYTEQEDKQLLELLLKLK